MWLEHGQIVEKGTHNELFLKGGRDHQLYELLLQVQPNGAFSEEYK